MTGKRTQNETQAPFILIKIVTARVMKFMILCTLFAVASAANCYAPIELVFALDESGSVGSSNYNKAKGALLFIAARSLLRP